MNIQEHIRNVLCKVSVWQLKEKNVKRSVWDNIWLSGATESDQWEMDGPLLTVIASADSPRSPSTCLSTVSDNMCLPAHCTSLVVLTWTYEYFIFPFHMFKNVVQELKKYFKNELPLTFIILRNMLTIKPLILI